MIALFCLSQMAPYLYKEKGTICDAAWDYALCVSSEPYFHNVDLFSATE
jgi:hypothetical protein